MPKNGSVAEPGLSAVAPGSGVIKMPPVSARVWFDLRKTMDFHQHINVEERICREDDYTESITQLISSSQSGGIKIDPGAVTDQKVIAGIGNAYSDEILHAARLSPYAPADSLTPQQVAELHTAIRQILTEAAERARSADLGKIKAEKRAGLRVHNRTGEPCDVCVTTIAQVRLADSAFQYCPTCQTGGKPLADRRMSRLLK